VKEIAINGQVKMTVKEVAEAFGISPDTLKITIREVFPELMQNGVTTYLTEKQVTALKFNLRKNSQVMKQPTTSLERALRRKQALQEADEEIEQLLNENTALTIENMELKPKAEIHTYSKTYVTGKGLHFLRELLSQDGFIPKLTELREAKQ